MPRFVLNSACLLAAVTVLAFASACAEKGFAPQPESLPARSSTPPPAPATKPYVLPEEPVPPEVRYRETGMASWFGSECQGRKRAQGEVVEADAMTAFHRTLPIGSIIRVTNTDNQKSVAVTVIDHGPFVVSRIIELSYAAAHELGFSGQGTAGVTIESISLPSAPSRYTVQAAVFTEQENANFLKDRLSKKYESIAILPAWSKFGTLYRVLIGSYRTEEKAASVAARLKLEGLEPFVIRKDGK